MVVVVVVCLQCRDRPELIFINSAKTETGPKYSNVVLAENETEAEFNILFRPIPKPKINNTECITYLIQEKDTETTSVSN